jgi:flagellar biosynthesis protein FliQ
MKVLVVLVVLFLVAAWQLGMFADLWNSITSKVPSVDVTTK